MDPCGTSELAHGLTPAGKKVYILLNLRLSLKCDWGYGGPATGSKIVLLFSFTKGHISFKSCINKNAFLSRRRIPLATFS